MKMRKEEHQVRGRDRNIFIVELTPASADCIARILGEHVEEKNIRNDRHCATTFASLYKSLKDMKIGSVESLP